MESWYLQIFIVCILLYGFRGTGKDDTEDLKVKSVLR